MAPVLRHPDTPTITEEEFQEWRYNTFHREWDVDESEVEEDFTPFFVNKEAYEAWLEYWSCIIQHQNSR